MSAPMSDTATFPFDTSQDLDDVEATKSRRPLYLLLAVGAVVAAVVGYFLAVSVFGGAGEVAAPAAVSPTAPAANASPSTNPPQQVRQTVAVGVNRNPFLPLVFPTTAGGTAAAPVATPAPSPSAQQTTTPGMTTFKVLSIAGSRATVSIDGVRYTVTVGQSFARTYKLVSTSGGVCGEFTNAGSRLGLCEGQTLIF